MCFTVSKCSTEPPWASAAHSRHIMSLILLGGCKQSILPSGVNAPSATSRDRSQACNTAFNVRSFSAQDVGEDAEEATDENKNIRKIVEIDSMATPILAIRGCCVLASFRQACNTDSWADIMTTNRKTTKVHKFSIKKSVGW